MKQKSGASRMLRALIAAAFVSWGTAHAQAVPESGGPIGQPGAVGQPETPAPTSAPLELRPSLVGPGTGSPFGLITTPGNPFGRTPTTALPEVVERNAAGVRVGPGSVYPVIGVALNYDDNIFSSNAIQRSSWVMITSPAVRAEVRSPGGHTFGVSYRADIGRYWSSPADHYDDQLVVADAHVNISSKARLLVRTEYLHLHDARGTTDRAFGAEPDVYNAPAVAARVSYGAAGAQGRIDVEAGRQNRRYENNRPSTVLADRDATYFGGVFTMRVMPATSLVLDYRLLDTDYKSPEATQDSTEHRYRVGVTWEATAKTAAMFSIGHVTRNFDSPLREDFSGLSFEGRARWSPRTYSTFEVTTAQETNEATGVGDFILSRLLYGTWTHAWNSRLRSNVFIGFRNDDYRGTGAGRNDDVHAIGGGLTYDMRRWLNLGAQYIYTSRSSNSPVNEYDRNILMLSVAGTL